MDTEGDETMVNRAGLTHWSRQEGWQNSTIAHLWTALQVPMVITFITWLLLSLVHKVSPSVHLHNFFHLSL
ncbi:hypothetical protein Hanom_Chr08g00702261 [Helianthus anomalus]